MKIQTNTTTSPTALHQPFTWLHVSVQNDAHAEFLAMAKSMCTGVAVCLQLVAQSELARDNGSVPVLDIGDSESLLMLAIESAKLLSSAAEIEIDTINERAIKGGAA